MVRRLASHVSAFVVGRLEVAMINHYKVEGVVSTKQSVKTDFDLLAPSAAPGSVRGYDTSSSSIRVTWASVAAVHQNGIIVSYRVSYQAVGGSFIDGTKRDKQVAGASNQADLTGLEAYVDYKIIVYASTSAGEGPSSTSIVVKTAEAGKTLSFDLS